MAWETMPRFHLPFFPRRSRRESAPTRPPTPTFTHDRLSPTLLKNPVMGPARNIVTGGHALPHPVHQNPGPQSPHPWSTPQLLPLDLPAPMQTIWFSSVPETRFYRHSPNYPCPLLIGHTTYPSAEHLYHALKFSRHRYRAVVAAILAAPTASDAREVAFQNRTFADLWTDQDALDARRFTLGFKYCQHLELAVELVNDMAGYLVFESRDSFWGREKDQGVGYNEFGRALMETRARLILEGRSDMRSIVVACWRFGIRA